jgi:hypothetical protein
MPTPPSPSPSDLSPDSEVTLDPRYWVPLGLTLLGPVSLLSAPLWGGARWLCLGLVLFGGFLLLQAAILRLRFSADALVVLRLDQEIRRFPYSEWSSWRVFWPSVPVLFYFRETRSFHLLPMLFDGSELRRQLELRVAPVQPTPPR